MGKDHRIENMEVPGDGCPGGEQTEREAKERGLPSPPETKSCVRISLPAHLSIEATHSNVFTLFSDLV